ncbi:MAG: phosphatase PAP2 family protein [Planctomycetaceae bacterium]|nr:phosphatase PAP2 family protein [Planctomycetaceae bacterium]
MSNPRPNRRGLFLAAFLLLAAIAALCADVPIATAVQGMKHELDPGVWTKACLACLNALNIFEPFGHGLGIVVVVIVLHQLDRNRRWAIPRVLACALGSGLAADFVKLTIIRCRPYGLQFPFAGQVWETFGDWWPIFGVGSKSQSFPSAHTATAIGLAAALIWLYPQGRRLFIVLAVLVGCQRIAAGAHYASDVLVGAAIGCLVSTLLLNVGRLPTWFERWERQHWRRKPVSLPSKDSATPTRAIERPPLA